MAGQCGRAVGANKNWAFIAGGRVDVTLPAFFFFFWNAAVPMRRSGNKNTPNFVPHFLQTILLFDTTWINEAAWPTIKEQVCVFYKKKKKKTRPTALFSLCALLKQWIKLRGGGYIDSCLLQPFSLRCCQWQHFVVFFLGGIKSPVIATLSQENQVKRRLHSPAKVFLKLIAELTGEKHEAAIWIDGKRNFNSTTNPHGGSVFFVVVVSPFNMVKGQVTRRRIPPVVVWVVRVCPSQIGYLLCSVQRWR